MEKKNRKPRIAVIGLKGLPAFGGAATVGENIIEKLKDKYDFTVYSVSSHTELKTGEYYGYRQIVFKSFFKGGINTLMYYFKSALHCLFFSNYDLIHLHHIDGGYILPLLRLRYKVISTAHGRPQDCDKWNIFIKLFFKFNEKIFLNLSSYITVVGKPLFEIYKNNRNESILYIPNGINVNILKSSNVKEKDLLTFAAGRILPTKGCHTFLKAAKEIDYQGQIYIIGDAKQLNSYYKLITKLSKDLNVNFLGLIKNKKELLEIISSSKFFIFPSEIEAMSMMLLEVASQMVPIIASDIPENTSVFNKKEVLFFKNKDVNDLAEKIKYAMNNYEEMSNMANLALDRLNKEYTWDKIASQYAILYESLFKSFN